MSIPEDINSNEFIDIKRKFDFILNRLTSSFIGSPEITEMHFRGLEEGYGLAIIRLGLLGEEMERRGFKTGNDSIKEIIKYLGNWKKDLSGFRF